MNTRERIHHSIQSDIVVVDLDNISEGINWDTREQDALEILLAPYSAWGLATSKCNFIILQSTKKAQREYDKSTHDFTGENRSCIDHRNSKYDERDSSIQGSMVNQCMNQTCSEAVSKKSPFSANNFAYEHNSQLVRNLSHKSTHWPQALGTGTAHDPLVLVDGPEDTSATVATMGVPILDDLSADGRSMEDQLSIDLDPSIDCIYDSHGTIGQRREREEAVRERRNPPLKPHHISSSRFTFKGLDIRTGKTVELQDGSFLRIKAIIHNTLTGKVTLRGNTLQRSRDLNGMLERKANEVCLFYEIDLDDPRPPPEQSILEVPVEDVLRLRTLRFTNQNFPDCRAIDPSLFRDKKQIDEEGGLTLRWKYTCTYASASDRQQNCYAERILEHIRENESTATFTIPDDIKRFRWRGETNPGGSYKPPAAAVDAPYLYSLQHHDAEISAIEKTPIFPSTKASPHCGSSTTPDMIPSISRKRKFASPEWPNRDTSSTESSFNPNLSFTNTKGAVLRRPLGTAHSELSNPPPTGSIHRPSHLRNDRLFKSPGQTFTYGDGFCGAGGSTRGAIMAGLKVNWGFDQDEHACASWMANFPNASCYNMSSDAFVKLSTDNSVDLKVDIMHLSPPCQYFSPAHTVNGTNDESNVASLFAVRAVIEVGKPRVVTLEQTFGIRLPKFRQYFAALVHMFTSLNFSLRWAIVPLSQWGLPQRRYRLLVIASCPGEILPKIPPATHSEDGEDGLKPLVTVNETLKSIPHNAPDHYPDIVPRYTRRPWDANVILPRAMTCHGGQNYHPSGTRDLTLREYACLQGFPHNHVFRGSHIKRQIGNAVPPSSAKVLFESIKSQLEEADRVISAPEVILLD
ncbi:S-adenosyl-L-methionine-dependent methyltransferase [Xylogone sp. PMI_703]|nr:S-adenosyl-L-methionine-dependent methyltransferase [Xylogone sp. PMI_703]